MFINNVNNLNGYVDLFEQYTTALCHAYDQVLEFNLKLNTYTNITKYKQHIIEFEEHGCISCVQKQLQAKIHPNDYYKIDTHLGIKAMRKNFSIDIKHYEVEFRVLTEEGYIWVSVNLFSLDTISEKRILCCIRNIDNKKRQDYYNEILENRNKKILKKAFDSLGDIYTNIVELDLETNSLFLIKNDIDLQLDEITCNYEKYLDNICNLLVKKEDRIKVKNELSIVSLKNLHKSTNDYKKIEARYKRIDNFYEWVEISAFFVSTPKSTGKKVIITIRNINEQKLLKGIVDKFVYDNVDYFMYLDADNDSYIMFNSSKFDNTLLPTQIDTYSTSAINHAKKIVVTEDVDRVIEDMKIENVLKALSEKDEYVIYCGVKDPKRGYTKKRLHYVYYDKSNKLILLTRTDVTDMYLDEKNKNDILKRALKEAKTDSLTGLYNHKTLENLIEDTLTKNNNYSTSACFFIDVDNFKQVNDKLGHKQGDKLLKHIGYEIKNIISSSDLAGRVGGDEFIVFLNNIKDEKEIKIYARKICSIFDNINHKSLDDINISCSVGISVYPVHGKDYTTISQKADEALYYAKHRGKNQFAFYNDKINRRIHCDFTKYKD